MLPVPVILQRRAGVVLDIRGGHHHVVGGEIDSRNKTKIIADGISEYWSFKIYRLLLVT